jgi:septum site-determining protein MinC
MAIKATRKPAFKIMNATLPIFVLHIQTSDLEVFKREVGVRAAQAPEFFQATPVVLSLAAVAETEFAPDWLDLCAFLRGLGMRPAGIMDASDAQRDAALAAGLAQFPDRVSRAKPADTEPEAVADELAEASNAPALAATQTQLPLAAPASVAAVQTKPSDRLGSGERRPAMVIDKPVRTGQRIHADGTDLIVLAVVSAGAELIADGDIHVYAPLRGRALAGARGNTAARIFSQSMEAELVSIAGNFKILEDVPAALKGKPTQVFLDHDKVVMQPLGAVRIT